MRILTAKEIKAVEENAFNTYTTEGELMLKAGTACFERAVKILGDDISSKSIAIFCGNGKNAGDGFVMAECFNNMGVSTSIVLVDKKPEINEPKMYFDRAVKCGVPVYGINSYDFNADVIIDCIFGIGFHGVPKAPFDKAFELINKSSAVVISIDTPSGTDATTGEVISAVKADYTIAVSTLKYAHVLPPANEYCGKVYTVSIGIPDECYKQNYAAAITKTEVKSYFKSLSVNSHKGTMGHLLNICGSYLMPGAAVISAKAALKCGVGLLKCVFPKSIYGVLTGHLCQCIFKPVCENESKTLSMGSVNDIVQELEWADSVVIGCGIGNNDDTQVIAGQVIKTSEVPIVLDADGINSILPFINIIKDKKAPVILTPHPGEMARLAGKSVNEVQADRIGTAKAFAKEYDVIVVLKGANTIVTNGKAVFVNTTGNPGMAMGAAGDMLSGMIGAFAAQGIEPFDAARAGVYIHGLCGDITAKELSMRGMTVEDMLSLLGALMSEFE